LEEVKVYYSPKVEHFLNELVFILFNKDYFSYEENALQYRDNIVDFIERNISSFPAKEAPSELRSFGANYIFFKANQRTTWYAFYEKKDSIYFITDIINSHSPEAKYL